MTNFPLIKQQIQTLEATLAKESRTLTTQWAKTAFDNAHTILSDEVAEYIRTAEKAEQL
jgi:hypothetical protein